MSRNVEIQLVALKQRLMASARLRMGHHPVQRSE